MNNAELVRNIISETSQVISIILKVVTLFRELLVLIFIFFLVLYVDILVTFIVFLVLSFCAGLFFYFTKKTIHKNAKEMQKLSATRIKNVNETFGAIKEVKIFNIENLFSKKFSLTNLLL
jgi:ABC-type multidrug transport system fused ATPase/permease subunit